jgi:hypothetical protein
VSPSLLPAPGGARALVQTTGTENRITRVTIYRTDRPGTPQPLTSFKVPGRSRFTWNARLGRRLTAAPAGTYLVGLYVADQACNVGRFPTTLPPRPGTTPHAGVSVRYLAAESPPVAVPAGRTATVLVDARRRPYTWELDRAGKKVSGGHGDGPVLSLPIPRRGAGAYALSLRSGSARTAVPVLASSGRTGAGSPPVLVVLPLLTWQGLNPVDDDGDGLPNLLTTGGPVALDRVLAGGLPADYPAEAALLDALDRAHLAYDVTTDLSVIRGTGPALGSYPGVILAGDERWITAGLAAKLRGFVRAGGRLLSFGGPDALRRTVTVEGPQARDPAPPATADIFGVRPGAPTRSGDLITSSRDDLGLFAGTSGALSGYPPSATFVAGPGVTFLSSAGTGGDAAVIAALRSGGGVVVDVGLTALGAAAVHNVDAQELLARLWHVAANR